jgi:hypothetical protein
MVGWYWSNTWYLRHGARYNSVLGYFAVAHVITHAIDPQKYSVWMLFFFESQKDHWPTFHTLALTLNPSEKYQHPDQQ